MEGIDTSLNYDVDIAPGLRVIKRDTALTLINTTGLGDVEAVEAAKVTLTANLALLDELVPPPEEPEA